MLSKYIHASKSTSCYCTVSANPSTQSPLSNSPPIILLVPRLDNNATSLPHILFQFALPVKMIVPMESPIALLLLLLSLRLALLLALPLTTTTLLPPPPLNLLPNLPLHNPRHHNILLAALSPPPPTPLLLQRPDINQSLPPGSEVREDRSDRFGAPLAG